MTSEQDATGPVVTLRSPGSDWTVLVVLVTSQFAFALMTWTPLGRAETWIARVWLIIGCAAVTQALWVGMLRLDLTDVVRVVRAEHVTRETRGPDRTRPAVTFVPR